MPKTTVIVNDYNSLHEAISAMPDKFKIVKTEHMLGGSIVELKAKSIADMFYLGRIYTAYEHENHKEKSSVVENQMELLDKQVDNLNKRKDENSD